MWRHFSIGINRTVSSKKTSVLLLSGMTLTWQCVDLFVLYWVTSDSGAGGHVCVLEPCCVHAGCLGMIIS